MAHWKSSMKEGGVAHHKPSVTQVLLPLYAILMFMMKLCDTLTPIVPFMVSDINLYVTAYVAPSTLFLETHTHTEVLTTVTKRNKICNYHTIKSPIKL